MQLNVIGAYIDACMHVCVCVCVYAYIHTEWERNIYIYIYTHTYTGTEMPPLAMRARIALRSYWDGGPRSRWMTCAETVSPQQLYPFSPLSALGFLCFLCFFFLFLYSLTSVFQVCFCIHFSVLPLFPSFTNLWWYLTCACSWQSGSGKPWTPTATPINLSLLNGCSD